jgi:hypothetical protein
MRGPRFSLSQIYVTAADAIYVDTYTADAIYVDTYTADAMYVDTYIAGVLSDDLLQCRYCEALRSG